MRGQRRGGWFELDWDAPVMAHPGWTNDTETLVLAVREAGWFAMTWQAREAAEGAVLTWGWVGTDDNGVLHPCHMSGWCDELDDYLDETTQVTLARFDSSG